MNDEISQLLRGRGYIYIYIWKIILKGINAEIKYAITPRWTRNAEKRSNKSFFLFARARKKKRRKEKRAR